MRDFEPGRSRHLSRSQKRKQNRLLNAMIAIVVILIAIVGYSIFFGGGQPDQQQSAASGEATKSSNTDNGGQDENTAAVNDDDNEQDDNERNGDSGITDETGDDSQNAGNENTEDELSGSAEEGEAGEAGPEGPWEPVGTEQKGEHQTSYERGSQDWNEQLQAVYYATGLSEDGSTLWWIEPDGGPGKTVAYIASENEPHKFYVVHIEWVDEKGWKPTNVETMNVENPKAWYEEKKNSD
ncbi:MAG TPA: YrrS family protein [Bacillales bacterium]|nr:YrrS family protein [Bacillales bacterium]